MVPTRFFYDSDVKNDFSLKLTCIGTEKSPSPAILSTHISISTWSIKLSEILLLTSNYLCFHCEIFENARMMLFPGNDVNYKVQKTAYDI